MKKKPKRKPTKDVWQLRKEVQTMKPKTAVFIIAIFGILVVVAAYVKRGEFGIGPEWALPVIAAAVIPLKEGGRKCQKKN